MISLRLQSTLSTRTTLWTKAKLVYQKISILKEQRRAILSIFIVCLSKKFNHVIPLTDSLGILNPKNKYAHAKQVLYTLNKWKQSFFTLTPCSLIDITNNKYSSFAFSYPENILTEQAPIRFFLSLSPIITRTLLGALFLSLSLSTRPIKLLIDKTNSMKLIIR